MSGEVLLQVLPTREIIIQAPDSPGKGVDVFRHEDVVNVIGHETITGTLDLPKEKVLPLEGEVEIPLGISKKD